VLLVHGINTRGLWIQAIKPTLEDAGFVVAPTSFGKFSILRFLLPFDWAHAKAIERVVTAINTAKTLYQPTRMSVISHSFGTYVIARILADHPEFVWERIIFCGSVVRDDFPLHKSIRFKIPLLNEVGSKDFLPALAESVTWGYGSVGSNGFNVPPVETRWHDGFHHSSFLTEPFCKTFWIPFLRDGTLVRGDPPTALPLGIRFITGLPLRWLWPVALAGIVLLFIKLPPGDIPARAAENPRLASFTLNVPRENLEPGSRYWSRPVDDRWIERYPSGRVTTFDVKPQRISLNGCDGSVAVHEEDNLEIFIPDYGCRPGLVRFRWQQKGWRKLFPWSRPNWHDLAEMQQVRLERVTDAIAAAKEKLNELHTQLWMISSGKDYFIFGLIEKYRKAKNDNDVPTASATWTQIKGTASGLLKSATKARDLIIESPMLAQVITPEIKQRISTSAANEAVVLQRIADADEPTVDALDAWKAEMQELLDKLASQLTDIESILHRS
jgi:pimeloyl-ACP methyl ester carboxylesterase